ncbi:MAG: hypothetical protein J0665_14520 [Deltaproteobacteria bacterium]|nr:hypothetical protein [Deltaproteobacteria bacterium]
MKEEPMGLENRFEVEDNFSLKSAQEEQFVLSMVIELSSRFGLRQAHDVATVLKVSDDEAKDLLILAAAKT